jgi:hypothetical protein
MANELVRCPVCGNNNLPRQERCSDPDCSWILESNLVLGRLTPKEAQAYQQKLDMARQKYQEKKATEEAAARTPQDTRGSITPTYFIQPPSKNSQPSYYIPPYIAPRKGTKSNRLEDYKYLNSDLFSNIRQRIKVMPDIRKFLVLFSPLMLIGGIVRTLAGDSDGFFMLLSGLVLVPVTLFASDMVVAIGFVILLLLTLMGAFIGLF